MPWFRTVFPFIFICFASIGTSAQSTVDSLLRELASAKADTQRVHLLIRIAWETVDNETDKSAEYSVEAIKLAEQLGFLKGKASALVALGVAEEVRGNPGNALEYYKEALALREQTEDEAGVAAVFNNIANAYELQGNYGEALKAHRESLRIMETLRDTIRIARAHLNIGGVYENMGIYPEAYDQVNMARLIFEIRNDSLGLVRAYTQLGHIRFELEMFKEARRWYTLSLQLQEKLGSPEDIAAALGDLGNVLDEMGNPDSSRYAVKLYLRSLQILTDLKDEPGIARIYNNLGDAYKHLEAYDRAMGYLQRSYSIRKRNDDQPGLMEVYNGIGDVHYRKGNFKEALALTNQYFAIAQKLSNDKYIQKAYKDYAKIYASLGDYKKAYEFRVKYDEFRYERLDETRAQLFEQKEVVFSEGRKERELEKQRHKLALQDAELEKGRLRSLALIGGALALAIVAGVLFNRGRLRAQLNKQLASKNRAIEKERERADNLLKNILPDTIAAELKLHKTVQPVRFESVTVMFTDFKGFTKIAETVPPEDLIDELDECFRLFDAIVEKYGLEKIKTLGDSYMCAGGLPIPNDVHAVDMVTAAREMFDRLEALMRQKSAENKPVFEMRVGIHTGPVVAGIVGSHKFAYDIWGDTVNTAARLEQGSEVGKINISGATYELVKERFHCVFRGKMPAKNKGEIAMYFVEGPV